MLRIDLFQWGTQNQHGLLMRTIACKFPNLKYSWEAGNDIYSLTNIHFELLMEDHKKPECNVALSFVLDYSERFILHRKTTSGVGEFPVIAVIAWEDICGLPKATRDLQTLLSNS